eukprot:gene38584-46693_t
MAREMGIMWLRSLDANPGKLPANNLLSIDLSDPQVPTAAIGGLHVVFVLDDSGSMEGYFNGVVSAYKSFLNIRKKSNQGNPSDLITVICFNSTPSIIFKRQHVKTAPTAIPFRSGGTDFGPAMQAALDILNEDLLDSTQKYLTPVVIFMSDGEGGSGITQLKSMYAAHNSRKLSVNVMGFGGVNPTSLKAHANAAHGKYFDTPDINSLTREFESIARSIQGAAGLTNAVAESVGKAISK